MGLRIRLANKKDLHSLAVLAEEFMPNEADNEKRMNVLKRELRNLNHEFLVSELDGEIVGFIDQWFMDDFAHGAKLSYVQNLYVRYHHRRKGIASKLLREAIKNARTMGVLEIHISAEIGNRSAIILYQKHSFMKKHVELEKRIQLVPPFNRMRKLHLSKYF